MSVAQRAAGDPARTLAPFGRRLAEATRSEPLGAYRLITVEDREGPPDPRPGQFYMLAAERHWGGQEPGRPYLPRAFSFCRSAPLAREGSGGATLSFLLEAIGPGTRRLGALDVGEGVWLTGPLGVGFRPPIGRGLLVGGGIGVAPLVCLHDELDAPRARTLLGFRSAAHATAARLFGSPEDPPATVASDDGSVGRHALVTELLREQLDRDPDVTVYACGPPPMLEAVRLICAERDVPAQLALEAGMACGFGACFGCVVPTRRGYLRLCLDGPVLDAAILTAGVGGGH